ncbi:MAG: DUF1616 domain-containing protein [Candidatus Heimdallarchaeota archaeon]|nr:DUF1616 domain-containing protein [Candidatus Heimdallarchaeota archaeon]
MTDKKEKRERKFKEKHTLDLENLMIKDELISILKNQKPRDVRSLVENITTNRKIPKKKVIPVIKDLEYNNEIILKEPYYEPTIPPKRLRGYIFARNYYTYEFWIIIATICLALTMVLIDVQSSFLFYIRYIVVCFLMLLISGWSLTSIIFPELDSKFTYLERIATAIGLSLFIILIDALFLNYTFKFNPLSIVLSLAIIIIINLTISIILRLKIGKDGFIFRKKNDVKEVMDE